ncbi:unnamed protein product [Agarophyton chilense]
MVRSPPTPSPVQIACSHRYDVKITGDFPGFLPSFLMDEKHAVEGQSNTSSRGVGSESGVMKSSVLGIRKEDSQKYLEKAIEQVSLSDVGSALMLHLRWSQEGKCS